MYRERASEAGGSTTKAPPRCWVYSKEYRRGGCRGLLVIWVFWSNSINCIPGVLLGARGGQEGQVQQGGCHNARRTGSHLTVRAANKMWNLYDHSLGDGEHHD